MAAWYKEDCKVGSCSSTDEEAGTLPLARGAGVPRSRGNAAALAEAGDLEGERVRLRFCGRSRSPLATTILSPDVTLADGLVAFAALISLQVLLAWLCVVSHHVDGVVNG